MFFNMQATQNKIVNYDTVNQLGIKRTRPVNVNGCLQPEQRDKLQYAGPVSEREL